ncbi:PilW family protein [Variovorax rhizosphaerae]|uniref:PilW family protein n=1 Tax=Variovorax rhizosphaerae TaxID=1836200 RepID=A0ABU8WCH1_9BURK
MRSALSEYPRRPRQAGFTLVELMVGLALGMLTVLVISQVLMMAEGKKRTVSMGSDAQINGALSLYTLQREIQAAGYGASTNPAALGCVIKGKYTNPDASASPSSTDISMTLAPIVIIDGAEGTPDQIVLLQSQTPRFSTPIRITETHDRAQEYFRVQSSLGVAPGDLMVAVPQMPSATHWCTLFSVTHNTASANTMLGPDRIPHTAAGSPAWNHSEIFPTANYEGVPLTGGGAKSYLLNLGTLTQRVYSVSAANNLQVTTTTSKSVASAATDVYPQIVNLQAMYGKDTDANGAIDRWDTITPVTQADWTRVLAIRVAVVARSNQYERELVTSASNSPQWDVGLSESVAGVTTATCAGSANNCIPIKVDFLPDWQHYRYKVYDTVVPLRNMLWNS